MIGAKARESLRRARRLVRLLSVLLISTIGLGIVQSGGNTTVEDDGDQDERVVFRHFV